MPPPTEQADSGPDDHGVVRPSSEATQLHVLIMPGPFPVISKTFILHSAEDLLSEGHHVTLLVDPPGREYYLHSSATEALQASTIEVRTQQSADLLRWVATMSARRPLVGLRLAGAAFRGRLSREFLRYAVACPSQRYDVVHAHFGPSALRAMAMRTMGLCSSPLVTTFHGYDLNRLPGVYGKDMYRRLFAVGECFTVGSRFMADQAKALGAPASRVFHLPWGVDLKKFQFVERSLYPGGTLRLVSVGRLVEVKGIEYGIRAVAHARNRRLPVHYTVVGDGPLKSGLVTLARDLGIGDDVTFPGALDQAAVRREMERSHVFLMPGTVTKSGEAEGQGVVLAEAQAMGLPVIVTRVGGMPEGMIEGQTGHVAEDRDVGGLAAQILKYFERPGSIAEMGRAGREFVERNFDRVTQHQRLLEIFTEAGREFRRRSGY